MKILVTGGTGMVGRHLKKIMPDAIYISSNDCDLRDYSQARILLKLHKPEIVIHLAAKVGGMFANIQKPAEFYDDNLLINTNAMRAARDFNVRHFIAILSTCIYPDKMPPESYPLHEMMLHDGPPCSSHAPFAMAKRALAVQIEAYNVQYGFKYNYLIPCNMYSEFDNYDDNSSHFVAALLKKIFYAKKNNKKSITLMGTGRPIRQFMHAADLARVIKHCIDNDIYENMNVATPEVLSIEQIAHAALEACDATHLKIKFDETKPDGQYRKDADITLLKQHIPGFCFTPLHEGLQKVFGVM